MTTEEQVKFAESLVHLAQLFRTELSSERIAAYCISLGAYDLEALQYVCTEFEREPGRRFFPVGPEFHTKLYGRREFHLENGKRVLNSRLVF